MVTARVWLTWQALESRGAPHLLYLILGLGAIVRFDMVVPLVTILAYLLLVDRSRRRLHLVLRPDVVAELWEEPETAEPYLRGTYAKTRLYGDWTTYTVYLRKDSPHIRWQRVNELSTPPPSRRTSLRRR
jgi:hypothetical protein